MAQDLRAAWGAHFPHANCLRHACEAGRRRRGGVVPRGRRHDGPRAERPPSAPGSQAPARRGAARNGARARGRAHAPQGTATRVGGAAAAPCGQAGAVPDDARPERQQRPAGETPRRGGRQRAPAGGPRTTARTSTPSKRPWRSWASVWCSICGRAPSWIRAPTDSVRDATPSSPRLRRVGRPRPTCRANRRAPRRCLRRPAASFDTPRRARP